MDTITDYLLSRGYTESTRNTYRWILERLTAETDPASLDAAGLLAWLDAHPTWGGNMRRLSLVVAQSYLRATYGEAHPALRLRIKRTATPPGRVLSLAQVRALYAALPAEARATKTIRDRAILSVLLDTGLRAAELCSLQTGHLHIDGDDNYLTALTKGGQWQYKIISPLTVADLRRWLERRGEIASPGAATVFVAAGGLTPGRPLTPSGLRVIVRGWARRAGIAKLSPHDFRRTSATLAAGAGAGDQILMTQYGWKDSAMPRRYTQMLSLRQFLDYSPVELVRGHDNKSSG